MKIKTEELIGLSLDYAVAIAEGIPAKELYPEKYSGSLFRRMKDEDGKLDGTFMTGPGLLFSKKWEAGGPIIEREKLNIEAATDILHGDHWLSNAAWESETPLIAAMRCYVYSKLGDEVNVPKEFI